MISSVQTRHHKLEEQEVYKTVRVRIAVADSVVMAAAYRLLVSNQVTCQGMQADRCLMVLMDLGLSGLKALYCKIRLTLYCRAGLKVRGISRVQFSN